MSDVPEGSVIISPNAQYELLQGIDAKVDAMMREFHGLPEQVKAHDVSLDELMKAGLPESHKELSNQVNSMDRKINRGLGAVACLGVIATAASTLLPFLMNR